MPKPKFARKPAKGDEPAAAKTSESEHDFLEAADEHELSGGKWRAGDSAKSARFFKRAIEVYEQGARKFPQSFDLAYNNARLLYDICEDDRIWPHFGDDRATLLMQTLQAHRIAMKLSAEVPDVLFNTSQVLVSIAATENDSLPSGTNRDTLPLLEEAYSLLAKCWEIQQSDYAAHQTALREAEGGVTLDAGMPGASDAPASSESQPSNSSDQGSEYATVTELVTPRVLIDTLIAQLEVLAATAEVLSGAGNLLGTDTALINDFITPTIAKVQAQVPLLLNEISTDFPDEPSGGAPASLSISLTATLFTSAAAAPTLNPRDEAHYAAALALANTQGSVAEAQFRSMPRATENYGINEYRARLETLFALPLSISRTTEALSAYADALFNYALVIRDVRGPSGLNAHEIERLKIMEKQEHPTGTDYMLQCNGARSALSTCLRLYREAIDMKPPPPHLQLIDLYNAAADASVLRHTVLSTAPDHRPTAADLDKDLQTAGVYYRGAAKYAASLHKSEVHNAAERRGWIVEALRRVRGCPGKSTGQAGGWATIQKEVWEMVQEGLLDHAVESEINNGLVADNCD